MTGVPEIYDPPNNQGGDYIVQVGIKNGPLLRAMRDRGLTGTELARKAGVAQTVVSAYVVLKRAPIRRGGHWRNSALAIAKVIGLPPDCLWPEQHLERALAKSKGEFEASAADIAALLDPNVYNNVDDERAHQDVLRALNKALMSLTPRQHYVLSLRYGLDGKGGKSFQEVGDMMGVSPTRVQQIEQRALHTLKRPSGSRGLKLALYGGNKK